MTQQQSLFTSQITTLNQEVAELEQLLATKREQVEFLEQNQSKANDIIDRINDFVGKLEPSAKSTFKDIVLALFDNNSPNPDPERENLETETKESSNEDKSRSKDKSILTVANVQGIVTESSPVASNSDVATTPQVSQDNESIDTETIDKLENTNNSSTTAETESNNNGTVVAIAPKGAIQKVNKDNPTLTKIPSTNTIYATNRDLAIVGSSNRTLLELWGNYFQYDMKVCDKVEIITGKNCLSNHKVELHLIGINDESLKDLAKTQINFKLTPDRFFGTQKPEQVRVNSNTPKSDLKQLINRSSAKQLQLEELAIGDTVETQRGEYEILALPDSKSAKELEYQDIKISCKCSSHNSSPELVGKEFDVPLKLLSLKEKVTAPTPDNTPAKPTNKEFKVGQRVEICTERYGNNMLGRIGTVSKINNHTYNVKIKNKTLCLFANEISLYEQNTTNHSAA